VVLAEKVCRQAIAVNHRDAYAHYKWGRLLDVHLKRYPEAEAAYREAIELAPELALSWNNLATLLAENLWSSLGKPKPQFVKPSELNPRDDSLWNCLGNLLSNHLGRYTEAEAAYRKAIEINPTNFWPWGNLGVLLSDRFDRLDEAETAFRKAIEIDPSRDLAWNGLGIVLKDHYGDVAGAKVAYLKAIELNPKGHWQWNNLGILYNECLRDQKKAEAAYRKAIELNPSSPKAWLNLGNVLTLNLGRHEEAEAAYHKSIEVDPTYGRAHSCLAMMWFYLRRRNVEARREASEGLQMSPGQRFCRQWFYALCFTHPESLRKVLPEVSLWCTQHPGDQSVLSFMVDAWIAYAKVTSASEARELLDAQPDEVKLAFETVRDAFLAHDDKDHLHRLAPERRAPVLKLLERLATPNKSEARKE